MKKKVVLTEVKKIIYFEFAFARSFNEVPLPVFVAGGRAGRQAHISISRPR